MVDFGIVVLLLTTFGRKEHLGNTFTAKRGNKFAIVIKCAVIEDAFHKQGIADVLLVGFRRLPEKVLVLVYDLLS